MRLSILAGSIMVFAALAFSAGTEKYVTATKEGTSVFKNETRQMYEQPSTTVGTADRLLVLAQGKTSYKVKLPGGDVGWVEKALVVATGKSKTYIFDNADVIGYLDNPTPVYIIDADDPNADPINLNRSFKDALRVNVDQETMERQTR